MTLLKIAKDLLEPGAEIMISGTLSNKHFNVLIKKNRTEEIQNLGFSFHFEKGQLDETLKDKEFHQSSGEKISKSKMMTFYATKKAEIPKTIEANFSAKLEVNNGKIS